MSNRDEPSQKPTAYDPQVPETTGVRLSPLDAERQGVVTLSEKHGVPGVDVRVVPLDLRDLDLVPRDLARRYGVLPLLVKDDSLFLATADPGNRQALSEVEFVTGKKVIAYAADAEALRDLIDRAYDLRARGETELLPEPASSPPPAPGTRPSTVPAARAPSPSQAYPIARRSRVGTMLDPAPPPANPYPAPGTRPSPSRGTLLPEAPARPSSAPQPWRRVLVASADAASRQTLREALAPLGFSMSEATTARDALARCAAQPPALLVIDAELPDEHGFDFLRSVRELEALAQVPVAVMSAEHHGWRAAQDLESVYAVGALLEKPLAPAEVTSRVERALSASQGPEEALPPEVDEALRNSNEAWQRGDMGGAIAYLERAVAVAPGSFRLRYHLGLALGRQGALFRAIREVERSVALNGRFFPSLKNLAVLYERVGFRLKALESWERAHAAAPDDATREQIKERVLALL